MLIREHTSLELSAVLLTLKVLSKSSADTYTLTVAISHRCQLD